MSATPGEIPPSAWAERLVAARGGPDAAGRVIVVDAVDSTQDEARRRDARPGDVVIAARQTAGRGRLGRRWVDTGYDGVAVTIAVAAGRPEHLAIGTAVGVARALEPSLGRVAGIKWPNDILVDGRKLVGILIEQERDRALIGIGVNVRQRRWPAEIADRATSLALLGVDVDRLDVLLALIPAVIETLAWPAEEIVAGFRTRDVLAGTTATFRTGHREVTGVVVEVDPMRGLAVRATNDDVAWLPAATTRVVG